MKGNQSFSLLEGTYEPETARQLILCCINEQIMFFNRELIRRKIYGGDVREVEKEIEKVESNREQVLDLFKSEDIANIHTLNVNGLIEIAV